MIHPKEQAVYQALDQLGIRYRRIEHADARTMDDLTEIDAQAGAAHCKNLFLCNRQQTEFYLLLLGGDKKFRTAEVSKQLGVARLSFGTPELLEEYLGLTPGAVTPMGLVNDPTGRVTVLVERDLDKAEQILVHPNVSTASIVLARADLQRFLDSRPNRQIRVTVSEYL